MSQAWIYDINEDILPSGHWMSNPPALIDGSYDDYFHQNLSHNILSNLFDRVDFTWYYTSKIDVVATKFKTQFDTIPISDKDTKRLTRLMPDDITYAKHILTRVADLEISKQTDMKYLYLASYSSALDPIVDLFELLHLKLRWLCVPFVALRHDLQMGVPNVERPDDGDLNKHLNGDGAAMTQNGVASLSYEGFLKWRLSDSKNKKGRDYAFFKRFFDNVTPGERGRGVRLVELAQENERFSVNSNAIAMKLKPKPDRPEGGGNGYYCSTATGKCEPGLSTDYCVKSSCP